MASVNACRAHGNVSPEAPTHMRFGAGQQLAQRIRHHVCAEALQDLL